MAKNPTVADYAMELYVNEELGLCSLCGNTGVIDTISTAVSPRGFRPGRLNYCICPNGQAWRDNGDHPKKILQRQLGRN